MLKLQAMAKVKVLDEMGKLCLMEIRGLKEGEVLTGTYMESNNAFDFKYEGEDAMLWVNSNCELIEVEQIEVALVDLDKPDDYGITEWHDCESIEEARILQKHLGGHILYGASIVDADSKSRQYGEYLVEPIWRRRLSSARKELKELFTNKFNF